MVLKDPGKPAKRRRQRGEGGVFQRCDAQYGCPSMEILLGPDGQPVLTSGGKPRKYRPKHSCRGMWIGQIEAGFTGDRKRRPTVSARTQTAALHKLRELRETIRKTGKPPSRGLSVGAWFRTYLDEIADVKPGTWKDYDSLARTWIIPLIGDVKPLDALQPDDLREMYRKMEEAGAVGRRPNVHRFGRTVMGVAEKEGKAVRNVFRLVKTPSGAGGKREGMATAHARAILLAAQASGDRLASRWDTALLEGMRQGECLGMEIDRVNLDADSFHVSWQLTRVPYRHGCGAQNPDDQSWPCRRKRAGNCPARSLHVRSEEFEYRQLDGGLCMSRPKSKKGWRQVPMVPWVRASVVARLDALADERAGYAADHGLLWCRPDGRPIPGDEDLKAWKALCVRAGVPVVDEHTARHTTGKLLLEAGVDVKIVQEILGHADPETSRIYQDADLRMAREALLKAEGLLGLPSLRT